jgi:hypothetical protein
LASAEVVGGVQSGRAQTAGTITGTVTDQFNAAVKDGTAETKMRRILDELKPEALYFTEFKVAEGGL